MALIWPSVSFDIQLKDQPPSTALHIPSVCTYTQRLASVFGDSLAQDLQYMTFRTQDSPFEIRGYAACFEDGGVNDSYLNSRAWRQARSHYQFIFFGPFWSLEFQAHCTKILNSCCLDIGFGIIVFVLKISAHDSECEVYTDGSVRHINIRRPELLEAALRCFVEGLAQTYEDNVAEKQTLPFATWDYQEPVSHSTSHCNLDYETDVTITSFDGDGGLDFCDGKADIENGTEPRYQAPRRTEIQESESDQTCARSSVSWRCESCGHANNVDKREESSRDFFADLHRISSSEGWVNDSGDNIDWWCELGDWEVELSSAQMEHIGGSDFQNEAAAAARSHGQQPSDLPPGGDKKKYDEMAGGTSNQRDYWLSGRRVQRRPSSSTTEPAILRTSTRSVSALSSDGTKVSSIPGGKSSFFFSATDNKPSDGELTKFCALWARNRASLSGPSTPASKHKRQHPLVFDDSNQLATTIKLNKAMLSRIRVLGQVDRKFILVLVHLDSTNEDTLLCVDQHAADERVRLERLEDQVFGVRGDERNLDVYAYRNPEKIALNQRERHLLELFDAVIREWGFAFETSSNTDAWLTHSPKIDTRVANGEDLRAYLRELSNCDPSTARVIRPPVITHFLHSRACRSAIMFGDYLGLSQCIELMQDLSKCRLPFQCAHGRPSVVPIVCFRE